jgi:hypothetical protein
MQIGSGTLRALYPGQHQFVPAALSAAEEFCFIPSLISVFCIAFIKRRGSPLSSKNYILPGSKMTG